MLTDLLGHSYKEVTQLLDKTFALWDMFIAKLEKEDWIFIDILKDISYKKLFLSNDKLREIYESGK